MGGAAGGAAQPMSMLMPVKPLRKSHPMPTPLITQHALQHRLAQEARPLLLAAAARTPLPFTAICIAEIGVRLGIGLLLPTKRYVLMSTSSGLVVLPIWPLLLPASSGASTSSS